MSHMSTDEMSGGERAKKREFTSHDSRGNQASKTLGVLAGVRGVCTTDTEHLEDGLLRCEDGSTTNGTDFDGGHRDSHEEIFTVVDTRTIRSVKRKSFKGEKRHTLP